MAHIERFCVRCKASIPEIRVTRGSCFCSTECRRLDKIERRRAKAEKSCRLCARPFRRKRMTSETVNNFASDFARGVSDQA